MDTPTKVNPNALKGLTPAAAERRLALDGPNELEASNKSSFLQRFWKMLHEPMFVLLLAAAGIYMAIGGLGEGLTLSVFVLAILGLTLYQEGKTETSIESLRELNQHNAQVIRDGQTLKIPSRGIVRGDLVVVAEGDRIPADGELVAANNMEVDESLLTGESVAVIKDSAPSNLEGISRVFSGTYVVRGEGVFEVTSTGANTEIGKIGSTLNRLAVEVTPLHQQTARLVKVVATIGLALCAMMVVTLGLRTGEWLPAILSGIALAMAILPEEYPVVLAIFPALGAHRLAKAGVLTRHINAIETLGATTVLCTDKTGTLTQNRMTVQALAIQENEAFTPSVFKASDNAVDQPPPESFHKIVQFAILASAAQPFDPMEIAFHKFGDTWLKETAHRHHQWALIKTYPLSPELRVMSHVWEVSDGSGHVIAAKGAPEAVMDLCHMAASEQAGWKKSVDDFAAQGLRVLAVAEGHHADKDWPEVQHGFEFNWLGLIGLADPLRKEVPAAMAECQEAGIRVVMITGDYPATAQEIASQAGMPLGVVITGQAVELLNESDLQQHLKTVNICARISPHQKLRIVEALKRNGDIVTMTGDGVNDAPALRSAHVGVAMGLKGTDVAREAADLVLVDDNFASIVRGIRTGRRIFTNLQSSMAYIFAIHIPIALLALVPMLFGLPPLFLPLHIALLEMIIDPACSLAFESEPESATCMSTPPRNTQAPLFGFPEMRLAFAQGLLVLAGASMAYWTSSHLLQNATAEHARTMVMVAFVVANGFLIYISKSYGHLIGRPTQARNWTALTIAVSAFSLVLLAIYVPWLYRNLSFVPLGMEALVIAVACGSIGLCINFIKEILVKFWVRLT